MRTMAKRAVQKGFYVSVREVGTRRGRGSYRVTKLSPTEILKAVKQADVQKGIMQLERAAARLNTACS